MAKYLALIRRSDFTDLFKYGSIYLNHLTTTSVIEGWQLSNYDEHLMSLFDKANPFESSFTYLVVAFESDSFSNEHPVVSIEDVSHVYPLDREAKKEFETTFDNHIRIEEPIWENAYFLIQKHRSKKDCIKGSENVMRLFGMEDSVSFCKEVIDESILDEVISEVYSNSRPSGQLPIWVYLLRYERHSYFPQETIGFFMDAVFVVCNYLRQVEVFEDDVTSTEIFRFLDTLPRDSKMKEILTSLEDSESAAQFILKLKALEPRIDFLRVAVLFLLLRQRYLDGLKYEPDLVLAFKSNENTKDSFPLAGYLLGLVLGHDKTYDALYENLPLRIYKSPEEMQRLRKQKEYEQWRAAEEMRRMQEEQERQKKEKYQGKYKTDWQGKSQYGKKEKAVMGGDIYQPSFPVQTGGVVQEPNAKKEKKVKKGNKVKDIIPEPVVSAKALPISESLFPDLEENKEIIVPALPCVMWKLRKGSRTEFLKKPNPINVTTSDEYISLYERGWRVKND